jgi:UDPglucose 6-dehydrogenase
MEEARRAFSGLPGIGYANSPQAALDGADCLVIITEWKEFRSPDFDDIKRRLRTPVIIDGRNLYEPAMVRSFGLEYSGIGRA